MRKLASNQAVNAVISSCGRYRYLLTRQFWPGTRGATFIMLNPSTADAANDDPTIRRCVGFARRWGCCRLVVLNLFALRATDPAGLKQAEDPVGPENRAWFERALVDDMHTGPVVCGWGVHGELMGQDQVVLGWLHAAGVKPLALAITQVGHPKHPLYVSYSAELVPFAGKSARPTRP